MKIRPSTLIWLLQAVAAIPAAVAYSMVSSIYPELATPIGILCWVGVFSTMLDKLAE